MIACQRWNGLKNTTWNSFHTRKHKFARKDDKGQKIGILG